MARQEVARTIVETLAKADIDPSVEVGHKQVKIRWEIEGQQFLYCCAKTASDHRALKNARCDVRRMLRAAGVPA